MDINHFRLGIRFKKKIGAPCIWSLGNVTKKASRPNLKRVGHGLGGLGLIRALNYI